MPLRDMMILAGIGDAGMAISVGSDGNEKASSVLAAAGAVLNWLFRENLEPYGDGIDPSKLLFSLEIYAKANCKDVPKHTRNHVL